MSKLKMIAPSDLVFKVKSSGLSTDPCGAAYESAALSECLYFLRIEAYFVNKKKTNLSHTNLKVYLLM